MTRVKVTVSLVVAAVVLALVGCGTKKPDPAVGHWVMDVDKTYELQHGDYKARDKKAAEFHEDLMKKSMAHLHVEIKGDGTGTVEFKATEFSKKMDGNFSGEKGESESIHPATWKKDKDVYKLDMELEENGKKGILNFTFKIDEGEMILSWEIRQWSLKREKKKS